MMFHSVDTTVFGFSPGSILNVDSIAKRSLIISSVAAAIGLVIDVWFIFAYSGADVRKFQVRSRFFPPSLEIVSSDSLSSLRRSQWTSTAHTSSLRSPRACPSSRFSSPSSPLSASSALWRGPRGPLRSSSCASSRACSSVSSSSCMAVTALRSVSRGFCAEFGWQLVMLGAGCGEFSRAARREKRKGQRNKWEDFHLPSLHARRFT
jgi:hypothetical protein